MQNLAAFIRQRLLLVLALTASPLAHAIPPAAAQPLLPQQLIVKYKPTALGLKAGAPVREHGAAATQLVQGLSYASGWPMQRIRTTALGSEVVRLQGQRSPAELQALTRQLKALDARIERVEVDGINLPEFTPNDDRYHQQWDLFEPTGGIGMPAAWEKSTGAGVVVAVLDTGFLPHADLVANLLPGYDFIEVLQVANDGDGRDADARDPGDALPNRNSSWHGTHVAGTVAAVTHNGRGVAGVAFNARVVPVRVLGVGGGYDSDIADGIVWAVGGSVPGVPANPNPAQVLNMSLGGEYACPSSVQSAVTLAVQRGATVVVAAGNSNGNSALRSPANCTGVMAVAATNRAGGKAGYSSFGSNVALAAPGGEIAVRQEDGVLSTANDGFATPGMDSYKTKQGTSMAAPHVAGAAALLYSLMPGIAPDQVRDVLTDTARAFPKPCNQCGAGLLDAAAAVNLVVGGGLTDNSSVIENSSFISAVNNRAGSVLNARVEVPAGASNLRIVARSQTEIALFVRYNRKATPRNFDCKSENQGDEESCTFALPQTGIYSIAVLSYEAGDFSVNVNYDTAGPVTLEWEYPATRVTEPEGRVFLTAVRTGDVSQTVSVDYSTRNGSATAGADFTATSGTLQFAAGQTRQTVSVSLLNDAVAEAEEAFTVGLSNPQGVNAQLGSTATTSVTIADDDSAPPPGNSIPPPVTSGYSAKVLSTRTVATAVPEGPAGRYEVDARFCNTGAPELTRLQSRNVQLTGGNSLITRSFDAPTGSPGGEGARQAFPQAGGYDDRLLGGGECTDIRYGIGLASKARFTFRVELLGDTLAAPN